MPACCTVIGPVAAITPRRSTRAADPFTSTSPAGSRARSRASAAPADDSRSDVTWRQATRRNENRFDVAARMWLSMLVGALIRPATLSANCLRVLSEISARRALGADPWRRGNASLSHYPPRTGAGRGAARSDHPAAASSGCAGHLTHLDRKTVLVRGRVPPAPGSDPAAQSSGPRPPAGVVRRLASL